MNNKILLINAINSHMEVEKRYPNLGLGYLASSIRSHFGEGFFDIKIIDSDVEAEIHAYKPDLIGITCATQNYNIAKRYAKLGRSAGIPVIIGGIHISMLPESMSKEMDVGVIGEGEGTITELLQLFVNDRAFTHSALEKIKGIIFFKEGKVHFTEKRELIDPLDKLPFPARDLLKIDKHSYIFSSRGCPYRCVFCASSRYWGKVRFFSAEYVVSEIKCLVEKYNVSLISFYDDLMIANKERLIKIVKLLKQDPIFNKVKFTVNARANLLTEETVKLLKEMRVVSVGMGLESGSQKTLTYLKGNNITVEDNLNAINMLKKYKIAANASFIIGSPEETEADIMETMRFIKTSKLDLFETVVLTPYPGTPIWEYALKKGIVSNDMDWERLNVFYLSNHKNAIVLSDKINRERLKELFLKFRRTGFYFGIKNILHHPFLADVPRMLLNRIIEKCIRFFSSIRLAFVR